jgi:hypothetical protein
MNNSHLKHLPIDPNTKLMKEASLLETHKYCLYQLIIGSGMDLKACTRTDLLYPICYLSEFLAAPSKSYLMAAKYLLQYIQGTKDLKLSISCSDASKITVEE